MFQRSVIVISTMKWRMNLSHPTAVKRKQSQPLPVSQQFQIPVRPALIVSILRPSAELPEHFVHGVDHRLRIIQLNVVA